MRMILAAVPFHTGTSIFSWVPSGPETVISFKKKLSIIIHLPLVDRTAAEKKYLCFRCDGIDGAHEDVGDDEDCYKAEKATGRSESLQGHEISSGNYDTGLHNHHGHHS